jgi:hypothetical protein
MSIYNLYIWKDPSLKMTGPAIVALISKDSRSNKSCSSILDSAFSLIRDLIDGFTSVNRFLELLGVSTVLELQHDLV